MSHTKTHSKEGSENSKDVLNQLRRIPLQKLDIVFAKALSDVGSCKR